MNSASEKTKRWTPFLLLIAAVIVTYANVYGNSFLYDDEFLIQKNENIRTWAGIEKSFFMSSTGGSGGVDSFYRPMQGALYTVVYQIFGPSTFGFHFLNVGLHALNVLLVFLLGMRLGFPLAASWFAALLWGLHPIHTEAVTYQSATADTLYTSFSLAGLLLLYPRRNVWRIVLAAVCYLGGMLSKETAIVFPALLVACTFLLDDERWRARKYVWTLPYWAMALGYLIARKTILNFDNTFHFYKTANIYSENVIYRLFTFFATLPSYLSLLIWPHDLHMDRNFPVFTSLFYWPPALGALMLLAGFVWMWFERRARRPIGSFMFLWFLAAHAPHMGVLIPVNAIFLEHWLYLPSIGLFLVVCEWVEDRDWLPERLAALGATALAIVLGYATFMQNEIWATPISFYTHILGFEPHVARAQNNLAMALSDEGRDQEAIGYWEKAIQNSDEYPQTHHNLALALIRVGRLDDGIKHLLRALEIDKDFYHSSNVLAQIYHQLGDKAKADEYSRRFAESTQKLRR